MDHVAEVLPSEVSERLKRSDRVKIIDVREEEEVERGMIPEAIHIPLFELPEHWDAWDREEEIIFVCRSGRRSMAACQVMTLQGFRNVKNLKGGMLAYSN